ncbi:MAG: LysR family transcriptional regulator [Anaerolineae bacterium]
MSIQLDLDSLRALQVVVSSGGVTAAAKQLQMTQSAVSHKIKRLEKKIGRTLFQRQARQVILTEDGRHLLRYAERMLAIHDEAVTSLGYRDLAGQVRLGITETIPATGIAKILARFANAYPNITLTTKVDQTVFLTGLLEKAEIDLALVQRFEGDVLPQDHVLWRDQLTWVQAEFFEAADPKRLPFIAFTLESMSYQWAQAQLSNSGQALDVVFECPGMEGARAAILSGVGIGLIAKRDMRPGMIAPSAKLNLPQPPAIVFVARPADGNPSAPVQALLKAIIDEFGEALT